MRGEQVAVISVTGIAVGSSPHAWGTALVMAYSSGAVRFIPTCVGNSQSTHHPNEPAPVHPHMRGEQKQFCQMFFQGSGSSPHAWGTVEKMRIFFVYPRFIPTCVGNSWSSAANAVRPPVHPHMRGEQAVITRHDCTTRGSSPHAWGTDWQQ